MILTIEEISSRLDLIWASVGPPAGPLPEIRLPRALVRPEVLTKLEEWLSVILPEDFRDLLSHFSLDWTCLGGMCFGRGDYLRDLVFWNNPVKGRTEKYWSPWWGEGDRPAQFIEIGHCDCYTVLLDCISGQVGFFDIAEGPWHTHRLAAKDVCTFVRCAGTISVARAGTGAFTVPLREIIGESGAEPRCPLWLELAGFPEDGIVKPADPREFGF